MQAGDTIDLTIKKLLFWYYISYLSMFLKIPENGNSSLEI